MNSSSLQWKQRWASLRAYSAQRLERHPLQQHVSPRVAQDGLQDAVSSLRTRVRESVARHSLGQGHDLLDRVSLLLGKERGPVGDQETEISRIRLIQAGVVHLIDDPVGDREPDAAFASNGRPEPILGAGRPARADPRPAGGLLLAGK